MGKVLGVFAARITIRETDREGEPGGVVPPLAGLPEVPTTTALEATIQKAVLAEVDQFGQLDVNVEATRTDA